MASTRIDPALADARFAIELERRPIAQAVAAYDRPDVLGFSLYPWNTSYSLAVAAAARAAHPDALIIAGGPSVPRRAERARRLLDDHPALDVLVFAEGELTFREILRARGGNLEHIAGLAVRGAPHVLTAPPGRVHDLTLTASPYLDGTFDELYARHRGRFTMALCETNRGCPFSCTFCDWSLTKRVVEFPIERVEAELEWVARHDFRHMMLADANFGIRPRDTSIARYLAGLRRRLGSPTSFYFYLTKNDHQRNLETIEILQEADIGCWIGLAVQDFDDHVLEAVKRDNIQTGHAMKLREICGDRGLPTYNELILGLPGQTYASFIATMAKAMPGLPRHTFVLFLCRLIDNTELGDPASRLEHGLETRICQWKTSTAHWDPIIDEFQEVVVATRDLPLADWQRAYRFSWLAAALYNLRLLRVLLHHVSDALGVELATYVAHLADRLLDAPAGSVYAELGALVERHVATILAGGPFVLPLEGAGDTPVPVDEAIAITALRRHEAFLAETEAYTRALLPDAGDAIAEAFRYQALITPRWGHPEPVTARFDRDWPAYVAGGGTGAHLVVQPTPVRFVPPVYVGVATFAAFAATHLGCVRARVEIGEVLPDAPGVVVSALPDSARSLRVLREAPRSG